MHNIKNPIKKKDMSTIKHKIICDKCKGNGYIKLEIKNEEKIFQCWICNSQGEIYEKNTNESIRDTDSNRVH